MRYTIVFWQPIIAIHQSAVIAYLSQVSDIILVVEKEITSERYQSGWDLPEMGNAKVIISPSDEQIKKIIKKDTDYIHVFAGINAYSMVYKAFKISLKYPVKRIVRVEAYNSKGIRGVGLFLKYLFYINYYAKHIHILMPMGEMGVKAYEKIGFDKGRIIQWGYFVREYSKDECCYEDVLEKPSILFVGSIDKRKNILKLVDLCKRIKDDYSIFTIIGKGPLVADLKQKIKDENQIKYVEKVLNTEIYKYMQRHDILILPSLFDGWGAVVNEALHNGMRVITSNRCGASILIDGSNRGEVYDIKDKSGLENKVLKVLKAGKLSIAKRTEIMDWAHKAISGDVAGEYFMDVIRFVSDEKKILPLPPWVDINSSSHKYL